MAADPRYRRVVRFIEDHPWAMLPSALDSLLEVLQLRIEGRIFSEEDIQARVGTPTPPSQRTVGMVAVIPVFGVMAHRMNMMTAISGGTSTEQLAAAFQQAVNDPAVSAIVLDIDSPGGSVFGVQELADVIYRGRGAKPITAVANATAASAAYWIGSQADELVVTPSGHVGSIGAIAVHMDRSKQAEMLGVRPTFITAGKFKGDGNELEPLDDATRADMQHRVDQYYDAFTRAVARGRGVKLTDVTDGFGEGRMVSAPDAVKLGMVDGLGTLDAVIGKLASGSRSVIGASAPPEAIQAEESAPEPIEARARAEAEGLRALLAARGA